MSDRPPPQTAPYAPAGKMPGEVARGLTSLWIIIHFAGILLAVFTLNELARAPADGALGSSRLLDQLKLAPPINQYVKALWLDVPYNFYLADGGPLDGDFSLRLELIHKDGKTETLRIPSDDIWFGERRERLARLAMLMARAFEMDQSELAAKIGKSILAQNQADEMKLFVIRHQPLSVEDARSTDVTQRDPSHRRTFVQAFEATVSLDIAGNAQVSMKKEALDVAPVNRSDSKSNSNTPDSTKRRKAADKLPLPELPKNSTIPKSLIPPARPPADPNSPTK